MTYQNMTYLVPIDVLRILFLCVANLHRNWNNTQYSSFYTIREESKNNFAFPQLFDDNFNAESLILSQTNISKNGGISLFTSADTVCGVRKSFMPLLSSHNNNNMKQFN